MTGVFCAILAGLCFLLAGLMGRAFSLDPIVPFSMIAGVLGPLVMVTAGMLARWSSQDPFDEMQPDSPAITSLAAGLLTAIPGAMICFLMQAISRDTVFSSVFLPGFDAGAWPGLAMLLAAYLAFSVIGSEVYWIIFTAQR
jgi:hypothetical protein